MGDQYDGRGDVVIPDALRGYRSWRLDHPTGSLFPVHADCTARWRTRRMTAICDNELSLTLDRKPHPGERAPAADCTCGFYATYDHVMYRQHLPKPWDFYRGKPRRFVHGSVLASGRIILGEWGFRAQYAKIEALWGIDSWSIAKAYGVPWVRTRDAFLKQYPAPDVSGLLNDIEGSQR